MSLGEIVFWVIIAACVGVAACDFGADRDGEDER